MLFRLFFILRKCLDEAREIHQTHCRDCCDYDGDFKELRELDREELTGSKATLAEDLADGYRCVGHECRDGNWRIFPPDYEPPLPKRDV